MFRKRAGLAMLETIIVLAISGLLFVIVIGALTTRRKLAADEDARQLMDQIALIRNQAQQGYTPVQPDCGGLVNSCEFFGIAVGIMNDYPKLRVRYLAKYPDKYIAGEYNNRGAIYGYYNYEADLKSGFNWNVNPYPTGFATPYCASGDNFNSCNMLGSSSYLQQQLQTRDYYTYFLVFRAGTNQTYLMTDIGDTNSYMDLNNYTPSNQPKVRFAFGVPGSGATQKERYDNASAKYYANFDLSIPGNQDLQVVK